MAIIGFSLMAMVIFSGMKGTVRPSLLRRVSIFVSNMVKYLLFKIVGLDILYAHTIYGVYELYGMQYIEKISKPHSLFLYSLFFAVLPRLMQNA